MTSRSSAARPRGSLAGTTASSPPRPSNGSSASPTTSSPPPRRVTTYLPLLVERFAADRLRALAHAQGAIVSDIPEILVVCTHNAGRSVAARVLLDHYGQGRVTVRSAGSAPSEEISPAVAQLLTARGLDVSREFPKPLTDEAARSADVIITMGCGDACPVFPGKRYLDWDLEDPAGRSIDEVRPIVADIERRARVLLSELLSTTVE